MSKAEEKFMRAKDAMQKAILEFYEACQGIDINIEGFSEDVNEAMQETVGNKVEIEIEIY